MVPLTASAFLVRIVHLFLTSWDGERSTLVLKDVGLMKMNDVMQGNIISELRFISLEKLEMGDVSELHLCCADAELLQNVLITAQEKKLSILEMSTSYGAQGKVLFESWRYWLNAFCPDSLRHRPKREENLHGRWSVEALCEATLSIPCRRSSCLRRQESAPR